MSRDSPLVGLVPAAGHATRLAGLGHSKELAPVRPPAGSGPPRPVVEHLLAALAGAGVPRAFVILRTGKWDVPERLAAAPPAASPDLAYLVTRGTASIPATLDLAYPFVRESTVVTGFADSCFTPLDAVDRAVRRHRESEADATLALFPSDRPDKTDMVELDGGRVTGFRVKPGPCDLEFTFGAAVWGPAFTRLLHGHPAVVTPREGAELQISQVLGAALEAGMTIDAEIASDGRYVDVGTPEDLARARRRGARG